MKKLLILLLAAVLLCGCAGAPGEEPTADTSASPPETVPPPETVAAAPKIKSARGAPLIPDLLLKINAVVLTWGEPIPENDADYEEVTSNKGIVYLKVRASFDEVYFSTFEMRNYSSWRLYFTISDEIIMKHLEDFVYVPECAVNLFSAGKKQLVFLESFNNNFCIGTQKEEDGTIRLTSQTIDIVDGKISVPKNYYTPYHPYNKNDHPEILIFEDGMLLSEFESYLDRVLS